MNSPCRTSVCGFIKPVSPLRERERHVDAVVCFQVVYVEVNGFVLPKKTSKLFFFFLDVK